MKNKKIFRLVIIVSLLLMLSSIKTFAFSDVKKTDWFYNDVMSLTKKNIIGGYSKDIFKPKGNVKNGEALKMIFGVANMSEAEVKENKKAEEKLENIEDLETEEEIEIEEEIKVEIHWADGWKQLGINKEIIDTDFNLNQIITRSEVARIIVHTFELTKKPTATNVFIDTNNNYAGILYKLGIIKGSKTNNGLYFYPNSPITRAEMSSLLINLDEYKINQLMYDPSIKEDSSYPKSPTTKAELRKVLLYMLKNNLYELTIDYKDVELTRNDVFKSNLSAASKEIRTDYPEYASYFDKLAYATNRDKHTIRFMRNNQVFDTEQIKNMKGEFETRAKEIVMDLCSTGKINIKMTETEKAKLLFEWVIANTNYDYNIGDEGFHGYGLLLNQLATCQGYTATYNYMAKLLGIKVRGALGNIISNDVLHVWTIAELDGRMAYIDVTHGDVYNSTRPDYKLFDISSKDLKAINRLDDPRYELNAEWPY